MYESIPGELKALDQWVCVRADSKVPMMATEPSPASSGNPDTWSGFETALESVSIGNYDNLGFVFHDNGLVGIDIDCGYDEDGFISVTAADILGKCQSYAETSRSGRGFHVLLKGQLPFGGRNNGNGVEIYRTGRYFIMTGQQMLYETVIENQDAIDYVVKTYFPEAEKRESKGGRIFDRTYSPEWPKPGKSIPMRPNYPVIRPGFRNQCLTSLAGILRNAGYSKKQMYEELLRCNEMACKPSLDRSEVRSIVNSVMRYEK